MSMKFRVLLLSAIFTATVGFASYAMLDQEQEERSYVREICRTFPPALFYRETHEQNFVDDVYAASKGKARELDKYGVPTAEFYASFLYYNKHRAAGKFGPLEALFRKMPERHRKTAFDELNAWAAESSKYHPFLCEFSGLEGRLFGFPPPEEG